jgi:hypothetical protein
MKKLFLFAFTIALFASSCKKTDCPVQVLPTPPVDLSGTSFSGPALVNGASYNPTKFIFSADGTCTVQFTGFPAFPGSWSKSPNSNVVYFFFDESATNKWKGQGTLNATNNKLESGTFTRTAPTVITGTFTADKL